ncbi:MAG: hypothetical protein AABY83_14245 [Pseudomonadota bacterium]
MKMKMVVFVCIGLTGVIVGLALAWRGDSSLSVSNRIDNGRLMDTKVIASPAKNLDGYGDASSQQAKQLQTQIQLLEQQNRQLRAQFAATATAEGERLATSNTHKMSSTDDGAASNPLLHEVMEYEAQLQSESMDTTWARETNKAIERSLQNEKLSDVSIVGFECRTTICRAELVVSNALQADRAEAVFNSDVGGSFSGRIETRKIATPPGEGLRLYFFLIRNGYRLREG